VRTCIIGVGNEMRGDDGIGPVIVAELQLQKWDQVLGLFSVGLDLFSMLELIKDYDKAIIIDALALNQTPGKIHIIPWNSAAALNDQVLSLHDLELLSLLRWASYRTNILITVLGIEIYSVDWKIGLSPQLQRKLPSIVAQIIPFIGEP
jgi:hydrogenase maturation protease